MQPIEAFPSSILHLATAAVLLNSLLVKSSRSVASLVMSIPNYTKENGVNHLQAVLKSEERSLVSLVMVFITYIGYIGSQLSVLAEALGMKVIFYDILPIMPLGSALSKHAMSDVLQEADFVSLHVPLTEDTVNLIQASHISMMKKGSYLLNASRGTVVDIAALKDALELSLIHI